MSAVVDASPVIRRLGRVEYLPTVQAMRDFTEQRDEHTPDEIWLCEHPPVYTQGVAGDPAHVLDAAGIPVVHTNRGGQVTYHGPGQVVAYPLVDLRRLGIYAREFVFRLEQAVIKTLEGYDVTGHRIAGAPGIYVNLAEPGSHRALAPPADATDRWSGIGKIAALGVKISRHCTYHGVALNVAMDLAPFSGINPCGYAGLATVDLSTIGALSGSQMSSDDRASPWDSAADRLGARLASYLSP